jgi:type II secretory pathway component PulC
MIAARLPTLRLNHALAATVIIFAALAAWPWLVPPTPATQPLAASAAGAPSPSLAALPPLATYAAIVERPLFAPSRRPAPGAAAIGPSLESRYRLLGIVGSGPKRKAFVADGARRGEIAEGDTLDGWAVKEIGPDRVMLTSPAGETTLRLTRASSEPAKPQ